jgi:UDP-N-acetylmuramyl pentapeptide phosphotransferase/UDP-N-acetylglucosamine-1-phosphate transferase
VLPTVLPIALPLAAAFATAALLAWLLRDGRALPLDHPNERSLHARPVPRVGGVAIFAAAVPALLLQWSPLATLLAAALAALSFLDDRSHLPIALRFGAHAAAAAAFVLVALDGLPLAAVPVLVLAVMWMTNLYNFMDGSDGLAGGMALFGFGTYAVGAWLGGDPTLAAACATLAACAAAFLAFNFPPARVFMGDAGSVPYGFLAGAIGLAGWHAGLWPLWFPVLAFSPFVVDASVTLARRMLRGEKFWRPHRTHYYQRLVQLGWGHRRTALAEYALMAACGAAALWASRAAPAVQAAVLAAAALLYLVLATAVDRAWKAHARAV